MHSKHRQAGMTLWGVMLIAAVVGFFILLFLKLVPVYIENAKVKTALENVARQPDAKSLTKNEILAGLQRRFDIEDIARVNLAKDLQIERAERSQDLIIRIVYEVRVPIAYNISALIEFNNTAKTGAN